MKKDLIQFTAQQKNAVKLGTMERQLLINTINKVISPLKRNKEIMHTYISSTSGLGKSHEIKAALERSKIPYDSISGIVSLFAMAAKLAVIQHITKPGLPIIIVIDDCDTLLEGTQNINVMKNILEGDRVFRYEKFVNIDNYSKLQREAILKIQKDNPHMMGFEVDCSRMTFIWASNKRLPTEDEAINKPKLMHLHAIRSRCDTYDFELLSEVQWGWLVDVLLNTPSIGKGLSKDQKLILLDWMYYNWDSLYERSIRTLKKLSQIMVSNPNDYKNHWTMQYLKKK